MTPNSLLSYIALFIVAIVTMLTRAIPYLVFGRKNQLPQTINYLNLVLPSSIMVILLAYCLKDVNFGAFPFGLAEIISVLLVIVVQYIKKSTFLSIILGTACYMILIRTIFVA